MARVGVRNGDVTLDPEMRFSGRGGYLHPRRECLDRFVRLKVRQFRSLRREIGREERLDLVNVISGLAVQPKLP